MKKRPKILLVMYSLYSTAITPGGKGENHEGLILRALHLQSVANSWRKGSSSLRGGTFFPLGNPKSMDEPGDFSSFLGNLLYRYGSRLRLVRFGKNPSLLPVLQSSS